MCVCVHASARTAYMCVCVFENGREVRSAGQLRSPPTVLCVRTGGTIQLLLSGQPG